MTLTCRTRVIQELVLRGYDKRSGIEIGSQWISSGESELISLGIELLMFSREKEAGKTNLLILNEPDVHLHPDLQVRLTEFLCRLVDEGDLSVIIATHSTAILGGLTGYKGAAVAFMRSGDKTLTFEPIGAMSPRTWNHPLAIQPRYVETAFLHWRTSVFDAVWASVDMSSLNPPTTRPQERVRVAA